MSRKIINLINFRIESKFEQWSKIFERKNADIGYSKFDIKQLFRGFSKDDPKKIICINHALKRNIQKFLQANSEWIKIYKNDFSTMKESAFI